MVPSVVGDGVRSFRQLPFRQLCKLTIRQLAYCRFVNYFLSFRQLLLTFRQLFLTFRQLFVVSSTMSVRQLFFVVSSTISHVSATSI